MQNRGPVQETPASVMLCPGCGGSGIGRTVQVVPSKYPDSGVPPLVTPTAVHEPGAAQETLVNGLDRSSTVQARPFQPRTSDPTAVQLAAASDLSSARDRYGALSEAIVAYMKAQNLPAPEGVRTAFCPMVQRPWLQKGSAIANPYYGKSMPTCGEFR